MRRMAVLSEWLSGGNQPAGELGWSPARRRYRRGHRYGNGGGEIEAQLPGTCAWSGR
jgi:hypothetical protein